MDHDSEDDDNDDNEEPLLVPLAEQGVQIREIHEMEDDDNNGDGGAPNGVGYQVAEVAVDYNEAPLGSGDDARRGKQIMQEDNDGDSMQTLYDAAPPRSAHQQARKRKAEEALMEETLRKNPLIEKGESSGSGSSNDQVRGAVGPNPPSPP